MSGSSSVVGVARAAGGGGGVRAVAGVGGSGGGGGSGGPCGACKFLRRKCVSGCIFAPYFDSEQGAAHFAAVHKVFGASNVSKLLMHIPAHRRLDAVVTISYEAQARLRDPVYGCVAHIFALQQQVANLQAEVSYLRAHLATQELPSPPPPPSPPHFSISDLPSPPGPPASFDLSALFDAPLHPSAAWSSLQQQQQKQRVEPRPTGAGRGGSPTETTRGTGDLQAAVARQLDGHRPAASVETPPSIPKVTK